MTRRLLDVRTVYAEPAALAMPRGRQVVDRWPDAEVVEVASALRIPAVHGDDASVERWVRTTTEVLALGVRKSLTARKNDRSANWIAPSLSNGCATACACCYVPRHNVRDLVAAFAELPTARASFATKHVNPDLLTYDPRGRTRVRFSNAPTP